MSTADRTHGQGISLDSVGREIPWPLVTSLEGAALANGRNPSLDAMCANDGSEQWQFAVTAAGFSSPAIAGETVYVGSRIHDNSVYALGDER